MAQAFDSHSSNRSRVQGERAAPFEISFVDAAYNGKICVPHRGGISPRDSFNCNRNAGRDIRFDFAEFDLIVTSEADGSLGFRASFLRAESTRERPRRSARRGTLLDPGCANDLLLIRIMSFECDSILVPRLSGQISRGKPARFLTVGETCTSAVHKFRD